VNSFQRILITGASGFAGRAICAQLSALGHDYIALVRRPVGLPNETQVDFEDPAALSTLVSLPRCSALIHLASHVDFSSTASQSSFFATNVSATAALAHLARSWDAHLVLASAALLFGEARLVHADTKPDPVAPYARAKYLAEQVVAASGAHGTILRIAGIYGRRGPAHLGINRAIDAATDHATPPTLYGSGKFRRNYVYVQDLVKILLATIENRITGYHLVGGREPSTMEDMLTAICDILLPGVPVERRRGQESPDPPDMIVQPSPHLPEGRSFRQGLRDLKLHS